SFLLKSPAGESARRNRNGKFLAKWLPEYGRNWHTRFASVPRSRSAMRLAGPFRSTKGSKGYRRKERTSRGVHKRSLPTASSQRLMARRISQHPSRKSADRPKASSTSPRGAPSNLILWYRER